MKEEDIHDSELSAVKLEHFVITLLDHMNNKIDKKQNSEHRSQLFTQTTSFYLQMASIISVFDSVDVDTRGFIAFGDFVDFCIRLGRLLLKPSIKNSFSTYLQVQSSKSSLYPAHKMRFINHLNYLFVMDTDTPRVRLYR
jgi:hypothetical protein